MAAIVTSVALILFAIPILTDWPIPSQRESILGEYYTIFLLFSAPCSLLISSIAAIRAVKAKENQNLNLGIAGICLYLSLCLLALFLL